MVRNNNAGPDGPDHTGHSDDGHGATERANTATGGGSSQSRPGSTFGRRGVLGLVGSLAAIPSVSGAAYHIPGRPSSRGGPEAVVRRYYRRADAETDYDAFADEVSALSHPVSPLSAVVEDNPSFYTSARRATALDTRVVARDVDIERVTAESNYLRESLTESEKEDLATANAVVAVRLDLGEGEVVLQWFLARADGGWGLVWVTDITSSDGTDATPTQVVRRIYRLASVVDNESGFWQEVDSLSHSESIMPGTMRRILVGDTMFEELQRGTLVETDLVARDVGARAVANRLGGAESAPKIQTIAAENAIVDATVAYDQTGETTREWLLATEADNWRIVWF